LMLSLRAQHRQHRDAAKRYRRQGPLVEPHGRSTHVTPMERW
jgi:hypothetical protein